VPGDGGGGHALYVGRLTREKGVHTLVDAWQGVATPLKVVGDGALRAELESLVRARGVAIEFMGFQPKPVVYELLRAAALLVVPSECYESALPLAAIEALAAGTPLLVPRMGPLDAELAEPDNALKYAPGDAAALRGRALEMLGAPELLRAMRRHNRATFEQRYSPARILDQQLHHYRAVSRNNRATQ
jgi:glycosyltransferase involved in cell wall biosynthesis